MTKAQGGKRPVEELGERLRKLNNIAISSQFIDLQPFERNDWQAING